MHSTWRSAAVLITLLVTLVARADEPAREDQVTRIGAVAYSPAAVTIFQGLTRYLNDHGMNADYVLYSNYDALVAALDRGEIEIAWNTPLAHAQYHVKHRGACQTLVMRDVDVGVRSVLVARPDGKIKSLKDLAGKKLILGSTQAAEATVLPLHFLKAEGVDLKGVTIVSLDQEVDSKGNPCASPQHVLKALRDGRGDAGIITEDLWKSVRGQKSKGEALQAVWTSPPFSHCVFTAAKGFDKDRAAEFTRLMLAMDPDEEATRDVMRLEGTKQWLPGSPEGFKDLVDALGKE